MAKRGTVRQDRGLQSIFASLGIGPEHGSTRRGRLTGIARIWAHGERQIVGNPAFPLLCQFW